MTDERIRQLERSVADAPGDPGSRLALARELARIGRPRDAREHVAHVLRADPLSVEAVRTLDSLGFGPLAHDAPWPTSEGGNDRARRSAHPGPRRGELVKRIRIGREGEVARSLTVGAKTVYVATSYRRLVALDLASGQPRWIRDFEHEFTAPAIGEGERLLVGAEGVVRLLRGETGETLWEVRPPGRAGTEDVPVAFGPRGLVLAPRGGALHAFDATTGLLRWSFEAMGELPCAPAVDGATTFVVSTLGPVYAIDPEGLVLSQGRAPRTGGGRKIRVTQHELYLDTTAKGIGLESAIHTVGRDGPKLEAIARLGPTRGCWLLCALDESRFLVSGGLDGAQRRMLGGGQIVDRGKLVRLQDPLVAAVADSGGCFYAVRGWDEDIAWFDSTGTLIRKLTEDASRDLSIGPDSTLLVATERGILQVIE